MAEATTWMPLYIGDYLGDTQRLTTEQHGAYLLLIIDYWRNGPAPDDDDTLQQITKLDRAKWRKHRQILSKLFRIEDGVWRHKRIDQELASAKQNAERRSSKAKAAAEARWNNAESNAPSNAPSNAGSMPEAMLGECPPPSPSPSPRKEEEITPPLNAAREPTPHGALAFSGGIVRVNHRDFAAWGQTYHAIPDLRAALTALDEWICDAAKADHTIPQRWRRVIVSQLDKKHQEWLADAKRREDDGDEWKFTGPC